jgi:ATP phosphoribosyltransferase
MQKILKLGLPKGSLQEATLIMFKKAGFNIHTGERSYMPSIDDPEIELVMLRAQEMSRYVEGGAIDCGITGSDWISENGSSVMMLEDLMYAKQGLNPVRWVLAVPENSGIQHIKDLEGKRIATELVNVTKEYLKKNKVKAEVEFSWGATEVKVACALVDGIVELTETGRSLRAHKLKQIATLIESTTKFIANKASFADSWKKKKMQQICLLLKGAIQAEGRVGLKMNIRRENLKKIIGILPALKNPTVSDLSQKGWCAVETIIEERIVRSIIPKLKEVGAEGIIEYPLNKLIY